MDVFEMEYIGTVLRNVLYMTAYIMNSLTSVGKAIDPIGIIKHHVIGLD
jgi:hypothetical protein